MSLLPFLHRIAAGADLSAEEAHRGHGRAARRRRRASRDRGLPGRSEDERRDRGRAYRLRPSHARAHDRGGRGSRRDRHLRHRRRRERHVQHLHRRRAGDGRSRRARGQARQPLLRRIERQRRRARSPGRAHRDDARGSGLGRPRNRHRLPVRSASASGHEIRADPFAAS